MNLSKLFDKNDLPSSRKITSECNRELITQLINETSWLNDDATIAERMWNYERGHKSYTKKCLNCENYITKFRSFTDNYHAEYCSIKCQRIYTSKLARVVKPLPIKVKLTAEQIQEKRILSSINRFGTPFPWQSPGIKAKKSAAVKQKTLDIWKTQLRNEGLEPQFNDSEYLGNRSKLKVLCTKCNNSFSISRYQNTHDGSSSNRCAYCRTTRASIAQHEINEFVKSLGFNTQLNNRKLIYPYELDIVVPSENLAIEFDGVYWHSEIGRPNIKDALAKKIRRINEYDVSVLFINEYEWMHKRELAKNVIAQTLHTLDVLSVENATICRLTHEKAEKFFNNNHLHGYSPCEYFYGLLLNGKIISAIGVTNDVVAAFSDTIGYTVEGSLKILAASQKLTHIIMDDRIPVQFKLQNRECIAKIQPIPLCKNWKIISDGAEPNTYIWVAGKSKYQIIE